MNLETKLMGLVLGVGITTVGCSDQNEALSAAHNAGWGRDTKVTNSSYVLDFTCGKKEIAYEISGTNPGGKQATATVCCGYMTVAKGCTIRY